MAIRKIPAETSTFHFFNANPANRRAEDCAIRAVSLTTDIPWDDTIDNLVVICHKIKDVPNGDDTIAEYMKELGWTKMPQPRKKNRTKYTAGEWAKECRKKYPGKNVLVRAARHMMCIKDGKVWDIWDSTGKCVGNYWVKL